MTALRSLPIVAIAVLLAAPGVRAQDLAVQGTFLAATGNNDQISKFDIATGTQTVLVRKAQISTDWYRLDCAFFSPDGKKIAFAMREHTPGAIYTADNNGANITKICDRGGGDNINWCSDGYIYWCENTNAIYRVNVLTKQTETYWDQPNIDGYSGTKYVEDMTVSADGQFGSARGSGRVSFFSLAAKTVYNYGNGGCSGWMSPGGTRIIHPYTCCISFPAGATSYNHVMAVESTTVTPSGGALLSPRPVVTFLWAPGQPNGPVDARVGDCRFAQNSDDYLLAHAGDQYGVVIYRVSTGAWKSVPKAGTTSAARGLWIGPLPDPASTGPRIALSDTAALLNNTKLRDTVSIANSGSGTLTSVTITESAAWLTTSLSGSGNSQSLVLVASASGLTAGTYTANVAVSGGGADNAATIAVTFNVNVQLTAPTGLAATAAAGSVDLAWTDNSSNEGGFAIERSSNGTTFTELRRVAANVVAATDTSPAPGTWYYRVRAHNGSDYSSYSNVAQATVAAPSTLTLIAPLGGETVTARSVVRVRWSAQNVTAVIIEVSLNDGETWQRVTTSAAVFSSDSTWADYPWTVPDTSVTLALLRIRDYNQGPAIDESGAFSISRTSATDRTLTRSGPVPGQLLGVRRVGRALVVSVAAHPTQSLALCATGVDGRLIGRTTVASGSGARLATIAWSGTGVAVVTVESAAGASPKPVRVVK